MNYPSKVFIGGEEIELKFFDEFEQRNNDNKGYYNSEFQVIGIAEKQKPLTMANTFLHEIIHAIIKSNDFIDIVKNIEDDNSLEEIMAHQLAGDLQQAILSNREVFNWYLKLVEIKYEQTK